MIRYIIYSPESDTYVRMVKSSWTSGHLPEVVNSYGSKKEAQKDRDRFDSLRDCVVQKVNKTVTIID